MADEIKKAPPVFQGVDDSGIDFQYEADVNKLCGLFYRHEGQGSSISSSGTTGGTISGTVGLDEDTKNAILDIKRKLDDGICNCGDAQRGLTWVGFVAEDPTELDGRDLHLKTGGIVTPKKDIMVGYDGREFICCEDESGSLTWIELGDETAHMWQS